MNSHVLTCEPCFNKVNHNLLKTGFGSFINCFSGPLQNFDASSIDAYGNVEINDVSNDVTSLPWTQLFPNLSRSRSVFFFLSKIEYMQWALYFPLFESCLLSI